MLPPLTPLRHDEIAAEGNPTGEDLLDRSRPPWKVWIPSDRSLVLGHSQIAEKEVVPENVIRDGIPLFRRMGGGGAVLLDAGCVCVGLRFKRSPGLGIHDFFRMGSETISRSVKSALGWDLRPRGISDLAFGEKKVVGCSLYMPRDFALYLASILVAPDHAAIDRYLAHPSKEPEYRAGRSHRDFVVGLAEQAGRPFAGTELLPHLDREVRAGFALLDWVA